MKNRDQHHKGNKGPLRYNPAGVGLSFWAPCMSGLNAVSCQINMHQFLHSYSSVLIYIFMRYKLIGLGVLVNSYAY